MEKNHKIAVGTLVLIVSVAFFLLFFVLGGGCDREPVPSVSFNKEYNVDNESLTITHSGGYSITGNRAPCGNDGWRTQEVVVIVVGEDGYQRDVVWVSKTRNATTKFPINHGDSIVIRGIHPTDTIVIHWESMDGRKAILWEFYEAEGSSSTPE